MRVRIFNREISPVGGPLSEPRFRLFYVGQLSSMIGSSLISVALVFAVLETGGSASSVGAVLAAQTVPTLLLAVVAGAIADRFERRLLMMCADVLRFVCQGTMATLILTGHAEFWHLVVLAAATGVGDALFMPATSGLIAESVSESNRQRANALTELATYMSFTLGPAISGVLVTLSSPGVALAIDAATYLVSGLCLWRLQPSDRQHDAKDSTFETFRQGWREFVSRPWIWVVTLQFCIFHALVFAPYLVLGPILTHEHSGAATNWGLIQASLGLGAVGGGLLMLRCSFRWPLRVAVVAQAGWAPVVAVMGWDAAPIILLMVLAMSAGLGASIYNISWETAIQDNVPERNLSSVNSYDWMTTQASLSGGLAVVGTLASIIGSSQLLAIGGLVQLVTCLALLLLPSVRNLPGRAHATAAARASE